MLRPTFLVLLSTVVLNACTTLTDMPTGTTLLELEQKFGTPSIACPQISPTRLVWSSQPMGQYAWAADIDGRQRLKQATQVLNNKEFNLLAQGNWDQTKVLCHFGPPAEIDITPYKGVKMRVWSYRYKQSGAWDSMMYVYFDGQGVVQHYHPGPDPLTIQDGGGFLRF